jgi:4-amino-4-deoxy-L-arabinose transferase-like glycosyltransferase
MRAVRRRPIGSIGIGVFALLMAVSTRYGWHRDELYFLACGRHLAWGFVDQPPFAPAVARAADIVAPGNLAVLRLLPAVATAVTVLLGGRLVRELGGDRAAQVAGAGVTAAGGFALGAGHLLSTATFDLTAWMALLVITARLLRTGDPRWWCAFGAVSGASMLNKNLLVLLPASLAVGLVPERRWSLLGTRWLAVGAALAALIAAPNLVWQAHHGWPQVDMARAISARLATENRATLLPLQVLFVGPAFVALLWRGARWLRRATGGGPFRVLLWAWPTGIVVTFATGGRPYYVVPLTLAIALAGVVETTGRRGPRPLVPLVIANFAVSAFIALPLLPASTANFTGGANEAVAETIGWPELTAQIATVVRGLPESDRRSVILLAGTYGEAGALDRFGPDVGLPAAYSPHNSYADFRRPTDPHATVVSVRIGRQTLDRSFAKCAEAGRVEIRHHVHNEVEGAPIYVCRGLLRPWTATWARMRFLA